MALYPLVGHEEARTRLRQAIAAGTLAGLRTEILDVWT